MHVLLLLLFASILSLLRFTPETKLERDRTGMRCERSPRLTSFLPRSDPQELDNASEVCAGDLPSRYHDDAELGSREGNGGRNRRMTGKDMKYLGVDGAHENDGVMKMNSNRSLDGRHTQRVHRNRCAGAACSTSFAPCPHALDCPQKSVVIAGRG